MELSLKPNKKKILITVLLSPIISFLIYKSFIITGVLIPELPGCNQMEGIICSHNWFEKNILYLPVTVIILLILYFGYSYYEYKRSKK
ncbi:hypothetical protein H6501_05845 [Candidatus Woesearchaeota archaeon]|nr:hypothetical protein [Candidatus Woesearchaeota archaeon]USN44187.1 MAG: hypothetical protein H6500_07405 [Candidatus Woesearchaeota archaeon]